MNKVQFTTKWLTAIVFVAWFSWLGFNFYNGKLAWPSMANTEAECTDPQITSIQFNAEVVKFLVLNDRLHLLMPLPITGLSATIVDIRAAMKKVRK